MIYVKSIKLATQCHIDITYVTDLMSKYAILFLCLYADILDTTGPETGQL